MENFKCNGNEYKAVGELENGYESCKGCAFDNDADSCDKAIDYLDCSKKEIIWIKVEEPQGTKVQEKIKKVISEIQQGIKYDSAKLQYSLIPPYALEALAKNLTAGLSKYTRENWKNVENAEQRYLDALYRHLEAHRKGEVYDSESSVPNMLHLAAVAVNAMFLIEFMLDPKLSNK